MYRAQAQSLPLSGENSEIPQSEPKTPELECVICSEVPGIVTFDPCGHRVTCEECCLRMKKCIICSEIILKKTSSGMLSVFLISFL